MNGFQILALIILGPACIWSVYTGTRHRKPRQFIFTLVLAAALVLILRPDLATAAARLLGIGRGADLVSYLTALAVLGCYLAIFTLERRIRIQVTELTRTIALMQLPAADSPKSQSRAVAESGGLPP